MKKHQLFLLVAIILCFVTKSFSQHGKVDVKNGFGLFGGITQFDIITDNFETTKGNGFVAGMSATVDLPHKWYNASYGMQLSENTLQIAGRTSNTDNTPQALEYKLFTIQVAFLWHAKLIGNYLTLDFGPMLQYNSNLDLTDEKQETFLIQNYKNVTAFDITEVSNFNANGAVSLTAGFRNFKLKGQYIYGFTNILNGINSKDNILLMEGEKDFKGNQTMVAISAMFSF